MHPNQIKRIKNVQQLAAEYYEQGNQSKCYRQTWIRHTSKTYPMCYRTFLNYIKTDLKSDNLNNKLPLFPEM
jgi:hypothetical protein